jgi:nickel/cobalt exporter
VTEVLLYLGTAFWLGASHAIQPGHGKTIAAAYIVGARGRPADAWVLGVFVTLSHVSGIVAVGLLTALYLRGSTPGKIEAWLAVGTGVLTIIIGFWTLWTQRQLLRPGATLAGQITHEHDGGGEPHTHDGLAPHSHGPHEQAGAHSHGFGFKHTHSTDVVTQTNRPSLLVLIGLGIVGGLAPDPAALSAFLNAMFAGKIMLGLFAVLMFSLGFAAVLVGVGITAAKVGEKILDWLTGAWAARAQVATSLLIVVVGCWLTWQGWSVLQRLA